MWQWKNDNPYGNNQAQGSIEFNLRFAGQYYDYESGLHYNIHRTYNPEIGRYMQSDPLGLAAGFNTYNYVGRNPLNSIDPLGLDVILFTNSSCFFFCDSRGLSLSPGHSGIAVTNFDGKIWNMYGELLRSDLLNFMNNKENDEISITVIKTTSEQDEKLMKWLNNFNKTKHEYSILNLNCVQFAEMALQQAEIPTSRDGVLTPYGLNFSVKMSNFSNTSNIDFKDRKDSKKVEKFLTDILKR